MTAPPDVRPLGPISRAVRGHGDATLEADHLDSIRPSSSIASSFLADFILASSVEDV
ncbi:hypothetical protein [Halomontanus rarus]|uniref:hypothetical protein n=1 Tax=Halomontanus rarus TaxID=3034020 RepID=UPI0023E85C9A|nr:hypothetical protein [Halovivax sp. TS33]